MNKAQQYLLDNKLDDKVLNNNYMNYIYTSDAMMKFSKQLKAEKAELIDVIQKIKSLTKSKAVNNPLDQIYVISDITLQKYEVK